MYTLQHLSVFGSRVFFETAYEGVMGMIRRVWIAHFGS